MVWYSANRETVEFPCDLEIESTIFPTAWRGCSPLKRTGRLSWLPKTPNLPLPFYQLSTSFKDGSLSGRFYECSFIMGVAPPLPAWAMYTNRALISPIMKTTMVTIIHGWWLFINVFYLYVTQSIIGSNYSRMKLSFVMKTTQNRLQFCCNWQPYVS